MQNRSVIKVRLYLILCLIFLSINLLFVTFKSEIDNFSRSLFSFTGEFSPRSADEKSSAAKSASSKETTPAKKPQAEPKDNVQKKEAPKPDVQKKEEPKGVAQKKEEPKEKPAPPPPPQPDLSVPVVKDLPKTVTPVIASVPSGTSFSDPRIPLFPALRSFTGDKWGNESTEIKMATTGKLLYIHIICFDKNPYGLVKTNAKKKPSDPCRDDSLEIFLMKDAEADHYCQYVASAAGVEYTYYINADPKDPLKGTPVKCPDGFENPKSEIKVTYNAFTIDMAINTANNIGFEAEPGKTFLMQIARNYRGTQASLQLFPNHIYCDSRNQKNNHDRRAFIPVEINEISGQPTQQQSGPAGTDAPKPPEKNSAGSQETAKDTTGPADKQQKAAGDDTAPKPAEKKNTGIQEPPKDLLAQPGRQQDDTGGAQASKAPEKKNTGLYHDPLAPKPGGKTQANKDPDLLDLPPLD